MALLNSAYSLQQGFYAAGVFPAPLSNYSGFSLVGLRMQPPFGALSSTTMGQLTTFPGGSAATIAAAASFSMENLRVAQGLRPLPSSGAVSPGSLGDKRPGVTDFSIEGILGKKDGDSSSRLESIRAKHKLTLHNKNGVSFQEKRFHSPRECIDDSQEATSPKLIDDDEGDCQDSKTDNDSSDNPMTRFSWLQCTRYKPPRLPRTKRKDGAKKRKLGRNPRVPFSPTQVATLEQKFRCTHYLSSIDVAELSAALNLSENRVKIWFQNRRARERRDKEGIDQKLPSSSTSNLLPPSPASLSHSPHTPISPLSSSSPSSSSSTSSMIAISPFASPPSTSMTTGMMPRLSSPRSSIDAASPSNFSHVSSSPMSSTSHHSGMMTENSQISLCQPPLHHLSVSSADQGTASAFTPVSPYLK
nr:homeobox protein MSX-1-like [Lytechinus pictus]